MATFFGRPTLKVLHHLLGHDQNERGGALLERLQTHAARHSQAYWKSWGRSYQRIVAARVNGGGTGLPLDPTAADSLSGPAELDMLGTLAESVVSARGVERVEEGRVGWCAPEILRAMAENSLRDRPDSAANAEATFMRSLEIACAQGALSWELRTATSLARLWRDQGRSQDARRLLADTYDRFAQGFATADLVAARRLLEELG